MFATGTENDRQHGVEPMTFKHWNIVSKPEAWLLLGIAVAIGVLIWAATRYWT